MGDKQKIKRHKMRCKCRFKWNVKKKYWSMINKITRAYCIMEKFSGKFCEMLWYNKM